MEEGDHWAGGFVDDLADQSERVLGALASPTRATSGSSRRVASPTSSRSTPAATTVCPSPTTTSVITGRCVRGESNGSLPRGADVARQLLAEVFGLRRENERLRTALESRIVIEQAKGVLAERFRLDLERSFELLRRSARSERRRIHELAAEVVGSRRSPERIEALAAEIGAVDGPAGPCVA
jgi:hypothetical protein